MAIEIGSAGAWWPAAGRARRSGARAASGASVGPVGQAPNVSRSPSSSERGANPSSRAAFVRRRPVGHARRCVDDLAHVRLADSRPTGASDPQDAVRERHPRRPLATEARGDREGLGQAVARAGEARTSRRAAPRSSAATIPTARSSTWTQPEPDVRRARGTGSLPACACPSWAPDGGVIARSVDLAREDDDDRGAGARPAAPRPRGRRTWSRRTSSGSPRGCSGGTPRRRRGRGCSRRSRPSRRTRSGARRAPPPRHRGRGSSSRCWRPTSPRARLARDPDAVAPRGMDHAVDVAQLLGHLVDVGQVVLDDVHAHVDELLRADADRGPARRRRRRASAGPWRPPGRRTRWRP